ncbi:bifunctional U-box domain/OBG-type guanine nucleotide-binding (G) domain/Tetratricopeptide repeat/OBG-type GTPase/GTP1-OBG domain superfamily/P-loop containing nucleoside triphosphate hydrolase/GTP-binding protein OBG [Babesia duncani]|uniref:E3 ubiquitin-protein ligase CHIP n=1 Tax=Babesia duncani TaxID=323732 RepID=A0AAD9PMW4_9APIC|nr:bifunctional U-box domain/OBG-type guanine nucleotide-binding (G) domain/Tetratricopeptide repeat/OBG-type GTPase/GTP1-OBG domain superfamily/P-loop containing nucleoside triphosphate hydrolase/GTP-binding protein OBG [Babesia duncani]
MDCNGSQSGDSYSPRNRIYSGNCSPINTSSIDSASSEPAQDDWETRQSRKRAAEHFRSLGNESFKRGFLESAIDYYSKAIKCNPENHEYYTNRALCYKRQNRWEDVAADVRMALNFEEESVKAHYYLGQALVHLGKWDEGIKKLRKAKALSEHQKHSYSSDIDKEILRAKKLICLEKDAAFEDSVSSFRNFFEELMAQHYSLGTITQDVYNYRIKQLEEILNVLEASRSKTIPNYLCCKISMSLFKDPAITPSGHTYERELLTTHLARNGDFDPVTRDKCRQCDILPNYAIKEAVENFLDQYHCEIPNSYRILSVHAQDIPQENCFDGESWSNVKLLDICKIRAIGGSGGDGCLSFRREKHVPLGGPNGGNGGPGGSVYLLGDATITNLNPVSKFYIYKAQDGRHGLGDGRNGAKGKDRIIRVPLGTFVYGENGNYYGVIAQHGQRLRVARGGRGAKGNRYYQSNFNVAPQICERGEDGIDRILVLDYKIPGDIALVGKPNVGKSSIMRCLTKARPRVANFAFSTTSAVHGVIPREDTLETSTTTIGRDDQTINEPRDLKEPGEIKNDDSDPDDGSGNTSACKSDVECLYIANAPNWNLENESNSDIEDPEDQEDDLDDPGYDDMEDLEQEENTQDPRDKMPGLRLIDVPGLIAGAHENRGLGHAFLKHLESCTLIAHVLDASAQDPYQDFCQVSKELELYNASLLERDCLIILNKSDLVTLETLEAIEQKFKSSNLHVMHTSAKIGENIPKLREWLIQEYSKHSTKVTAESLPKVCMPKVDIEALDDYTKLNPRKFKVVKISDGTYSIKSAFLERKVAMMRFEYAESLDKLRRMFKINKINQQLEKAGATQGDIVQVGHFTFKIGHGFL